VEQRSHGIITYSSGNHAQGVAYAARELGAKAIIVMPDNSPKIKVEATRALGAEIVFVGPSSHERKARAEELVQKHHYQIIPPYDDEKIIAGQGTIALEMVEDLPEVETVLCPVGGGGLISGVSAGLKLSNPKINVIGIEPELANDAQQSLRSGHIVELPAEHVSRTLADGLRTQAIGENNFQHISQYVDDIITVTEEQIRAAVRRLALEAKLVVEASGAVTFAAFLFHANQLPAAKNNAVVISGGNIAPELLAEIVRDDSKQPPSCVS
jgi:threonine dehydratase